jgi:hypothetical protein
MRVGLKRVAFAPFLLLVDLGPFSFLMTPQERTPEMHKSESGQCVADFLA